LQAELRGEYNSFVCFALSSLAQAETKAGQENENEKRCQR